MITIDKNNPESFAKDLWFRFSEFEGLTTDEIKKACCTTLDIIMQEGDTTVRLYYGEVRKLIKQR